MRSTVYAAMRLRIRFAHARGRAGENTTAIRVFTYSYCFLADRRRIRLDNVFFVEGRIITYGFGEQADEGIFFPRPVYAPIVSPRYVSLVRVVVDLSIGIWGFFFLGPKIALKHTSYIYYMYNYYS